MELTSGDEEGGGMADITKCAGFKCKQNRQCYRYMAKSSKWQSWSNFWQTVKDGSCEYFVPMNKTETKFGDSKNSAPFPSAVVIFKSA